MAIIERCPKRICYELQPSNKNLDGAVEASSGKGSPMISAAQYVLYRHHRGLLHEFIIPMMWERTQMGAM